MQPEQVRNLPIDEVRPHPDNPRRGNVAAIAGSISALGQYKPIVVQASTGYVIAGNHTWMAMKHLGRAEVSAVVLDVDDATAKNIMVADNRTSDMGEYDTYALASLLIDLMEEDVPLDYLGYSDEDIKAIILAEDAAEAHPQDSAPEGSAEQPTVVPGSLSARFLAPPFSVIDARTGWWLERKRAWLARGVGGLETRDEGREGVNTFKVPEKAADYLVKKGFTTGTSVFDPVMAELAYTWFCPPGGSVLDPFAGGPPRGMVAAFTGRTYLGVDLSIEQVEVNKRAAGAVEWGSVHPPLWLHGDSRLAVQMMAKESADMIFTCPPYYDLETYSDHPSDLSAMSTEEFDDAYTDIIVASCEILRPNRFAVFVVGSVRDKRGGLRDLRAVTWRAAHLAGLRMHSEAVLINSIGTAAIRAGYAFPRTRVLIRNHQEVLVFIKGDPSEAAKLCGEAETDFALNALTEEE